MVIHVFGPLFFLTYSPGDHRKAAGPRRLDTLPLGEATIPTTVRPIDGSSKLRPLLIGGGIHLFVVALPVGLLIYSFTHQEDVGSPQDLSEFVMNADGSGGETK